MVENTAYLPRRHNRNLREAVNDKPRKKHSHNNNGTFEEDTTRTNHVMLVDIDHRCHGPDLQSIDALQFATQNMSSALASSRLL